MENNIKEPIVVDYCKEAMELHLSKLPKNDIDNIVYNIALLIKGDIKTLNTIFNKVDEKTREPYKIQVPAISFLRTDTIVNELLALGISKDVINEYMNRNSFISSVVSAENTIDTRPKDLNEVKQFIFNALKEKYGNAVISKDVSKDIVIDTKIEYNGNSDVWISLAYFH